MEKIELLSPAKDLECAIAAIESGADAIYIGGPRFGARTAAGNSLQDLEKAVVFAHRYWAKVYLTLNTLLKEEELELAQGLIHDVYNIGIDAVIIQDMGILELSLPPIPLIASTQTHSNTWQKVQFLEKVGFQRVILPRECTLEDIRLARQHTTKIELEAFVHGSLCVCYSGQCYMSYACGKRSGNRGDCAQPCRKKYSLKDANGKLLEKEKHLLSLKDLNLSDSLGELLDAGITSFKIEGRLKDSSYVKNIVGFYRQKLDKILLPKGYGKSSSGSSKRDFSPDPYKTFNRGYTTYFLYHRKDPIASPHTPKSWGEKLGKVQDFDGQSFILKGKANLANGDGICFLDEKGELVGTLISKVQGLRIYPQDVDAIENGREIFRNLDRVFLQSLKDAKLSRTIELKIRLYEENENWILQGEDEDGVQASLKLEFPKEKARDQDKALQAIQKQISKLGGSLFSLKSLEVSLKNIYFLPLSLLNEARRNLIEKIEESRKVKYEEKKPKALLEKNDFPYPEAKLDAYSNILNSLAVKFYQRHQVKQIEPSIESGIDIKDKELMRTKLCLKFQYGMCPKAGFSGNIAEPLCLCDGEKEYTLAFDCKKCEMKIIGQFPAR
ncbi:MAG: DUF3656 domain-containing protein [Candidatus Brocadiae bacterium]|nr:DUF3656 domain-containing protein [Candidatus Brocadiia bacterium]